MALRKLHRSCRTPSGWRLATVQEAMDNLESIQRAKLLEDWERARLLNGWIGGAGYGFQPHEGFKSCLGYMLVVESPTPEISDKDDRDAALYSRVSLSKEGRSAALFLCCEDWNYEVLHWLIQGHKQEDHTSGVATSGDGGAVLEKEEGRTRGNAVSESDKTETASKLVSAVARELHGVRAKSRVPKPEFSCASMTTLTIDIQESVKALTIDNQESEGGKITNNILREALFSTELMDIGDQCWKEMGLTKDLERFREFDTGVPSTWEAVADTVWYVAADAMAVAIVTECCKLQNRLVMHSDPLGERKRMDDGAFVASLIAYAHELLQGTFYGADSLRKFVEAAAKEAKGDCEQFNEILRDRGPGSFSYKGKYDVVNTFLVQAAKKGDVNLVERLLESGVQPSETDYERGKKALHHAAKHDDESKGLEIAEMLLKNKSLANAVDMKKRTPLHRAAFCGHARMCRLLVHHNASVTCRDEDRQTPLHYALRHEQQNEEVIHVLLSAKREDSVVGSPRLVDAKDIGGEMPSDAKDIGREAPLVDAEDIGGKTPLDFAVECQATNVRMVAWLLSLSRQPQSYFKKLHLPSYLRESSRMGYRDLVLKLLNEGADPLEQDDEGKTSFHYAAEGESDLAAFSIFLRLLSTEKQQVKKEKLLKTLDKYGRNVLHVAAFLGHKWLCHWLLSFPNMDTKDRDGQSAIYYAVAGAHENSEIFDKLIFRAQGTNQVFLKDDSQTTPLHVAAARGNLRMVEKLLSKRAISRQERNSYVGAPDVLGQTALHKAASGGYKRIVKKLLDEGANPLEERDSDGKTALHYAAQAENDGDAKAIVKLLLNKYESNEHKFLLLFACAVGIGSAEQSPSSSSVLKEYLAVEKGNILGKENSLRVAAKLGNLDMTRELLIRAGENIAHIRDPKWRAELSEQEKAKVEYVLKQIDNIVVEPRTDKPALWDDLGLSAFANGLAALFLNPFVKSPITVGISGEWGMGKSSLMVQTERVLIQTAAQLAFSNSIPKEHDPGASKSKLSAKGEVRRRKIANALERLLTAKSRETESKPVEERSDAKEIEPNFIQKIGMFIKRALGNAKNSAAKVTDPLYDFLGNYQPEYHEIFKSLAVMDRRDMFLEEDESGSRNRRFVGVPWGKDSMQEMIPSILTVRYNAWEYRNESEAWAGLAVEITKELEATMTMAQKLRTSWRYNWRTRRNSIYFGVILPCFLAVFMAIWFTTIVWLLLDRAQNNDIKDFKYGSLPVSVIVFFWAAVKSVLSAVKPISAQIVDYLCLPDHSQKLGYQQKVIFDIKFLKDELGNRPSWMWKVFAFMWCCIQLSWDENYVPETKIPKMPPAFKDNLRIVVFVDDLDRCQENVILKVLSAVNLVLATCEINVILGMDKSMIERAIIRKFGDKNSKHKSNKDLADKYLRKIIQLPLDLPDPSSSESQHFLQCQLGMLDSRKGTSDLEGERERPNSNRRIKVNRKYQMGTSIPRKTKPATGETIKSLAEPEAEQERACSISDTTQGGSQNREHFETNGRPGPVVETKIVIAHIQQPIKQDEHRAGGDEQMAGAQKHQEDRKSEPRLKDLLRITIDMLFPEYSEGERNAFCLLHTQFTRTRNPREWKCLLTYHRLAWNILCKSPQVKRFAGWQVQLVAWVFVCWQWKHLITTLVQNWHDLGVVHPIQKGVVIEEISGPSLREIVEHYIDERWPADKKSDIFQEENGTKGGEVVRKVLKRGYSLKIKGLQWSNKRNRKQKEQDDLEGGQKLAKRKVLQEQKEEDNKGESFLQQGTTVKENDKASHKARNNGKSNAKDEEEEREEWRKLRETLSRYNVSMDGIQAFQKFRFYCDPGHLPWPLPKQA